MEKATKKELNTYAKAFVNEETDKNDNILETDRAIEILKEHFSEPEKVLALATELELTIQEAIDSIVENGDMFEYGNQEYYVLTDYEADEKNDEYIENYIDDCILPELPEMYRRYFDTESFKQDAYMDGRGHNLAAYDGNENEVSINGETLYIYRYN